jgi:hypothetical protein
MFDNVATRLPESAKLPPIPNPAGLEKSGEKECADVDGRLRRGLVNDPTGTRLLLIYFAHEFGRSGSKSERAALSPTPQMPDARSSPQGRTRRLAARSPRSHPCTRRFQLQFSPRSRQERQESVRTCSLPLPSALLAVRPALARDDIDRFGNATESFAAVKRGYW